jgi:hypothetical protein
MSHRYAESFQAPVTRPGSALPATPSLSITIEELESRDNPQSDSFFLDLFKGIQ